MVTLILTRLESTTWPEPSLVDARAVCAVAIGGDRHFGTLALGKLKRVP